MIHLLLLFSGTLFCMGIAEHFFPDTAYSLQTLFENSWPDFYKIADSIALGLGLVSLILLGFAFRLKAKTTHRYLETYTRLGIGGMYLTAAWGKVMDPMAFATSVSQYQFLPLFSVNFFSLYLPMAEFIVALLLIFGNRTRENASIIFVMFLMFLIALGQALWRDLGILCGCFPSLSDGMAKDEAWISFIRDIVLLPPTFYLMRRKNAFLWQVWTSKTQENT